jgi:carboxypeptidase Taq
MGEVKKLRSLSAELTDLYHIMALMQWDQEVMIPAGAAPDRANQFSTMSVLIHQKEVSPALGELLNKLNEKRGELDVTDSALVRVMKRGYDQNVKLPSAFVAEFAKLTSESLNAWIEARQKSDFKIFKPYLCRIVEMSLQKAEYLGYGEHAYDALLDLYEEGLQSRELEILFGSLREPLKGILHEIMSKPQQELEFDPPFDETEQILFSKEVLKKIGYDFKRGREDKSAHPFTTSLGHNDRRVTNRFNPGSLEFVFGALHEGGHALYEMGIDASLARTHLDDGVSLGIHESQSRFWENIVGRSRAFWKNFYGDLQKAFPEQCGSLSLDKFFTGINRVAPGPIRVEADEVTYNFHIMIRFELEKSLMEKEIEVSDLPGVWSEKYKEYLDVTVRNDAEGVLQDIHWSHGSIGYFPTYSLGNLEAAQLWNTYKKHDPEHEKTVSSGMLFKIREWLKQNIHMHGATYPPRELMTRVTGEKLNPGYFIEYLKEKYL